MQFVCRVGTPEGQVLESVFEGRDERALRGDLERRGYHVFEVRRRGLLSRVRLGRIGPAAKRVPPRQLLVYNQELAALLRSGLPLLQSLELLLERQPEGELRDILGDIRDRVRSGEAFSEAVASFGEVFPPLYAPTLQAGERSGELEAVVRRFVRYEQLVNETRRKVVTALVYPTVLIGLSAVLIAVMTTYVLPRFQDFFAGLDSELPLITRTVMAVSNLVARNSLFIAVVGSALVMAFLYWRRTASGRYVLDLWKLRVPLLGPVFSHLALSEFCRSLATLLAGGIPIVPSLESSVAAVGNHWIRGRLRPLPDEVRQGQSLATALERSAVIDKLTIDMVKVGETTGSLDAMLSDVSDFLDQQVETRLERMLSLLEPIMLVAMGLLVTLLLVSVYLPLYSLLGKVRG